MGFLNKWLKKKEKDQLEAVEKQESDVVIKKKVVKKTAQSGSSVGEKKVKKDKEEAVEAKPKSASQVRAGRAYCVLIRPIVSEKAANHEAKGVYSFAVSKGTNKTEIKKALDQVYGVKPKKVRIINMDGKKVRFGRQHGRRGSWKKAVVSLAKGQTINIHEGV
jgi:large subunit ribosomal protein L23